MRRTKHVLRGCLLEGYRWAASYARLYRIEHKNPLIVYQMGKVGSSTVVRTLEASGFGPVLHVHTLSAEELARAKERQRHSTALFLHDHLIISSLLRRKLSRRLFPCRIITLTREPVGRAISHVLEDNNKKMRAVRRQDGSFSAEDVMEVVTTLLRAENGIADPTQWFDQELRALTGVDVFSRPYDAERGYEIFEADAVSVLIVRMEDLDRALRPGLAEFLKVDPERIRISSANVGERKWYADILRETKRSYRLPPDVGEQVFGTKYFRHFYSGDLQEVSARWLFPEMKR